jgi:uncharacterized membrane protein YqjE
MNSHSFPLSNVRDHGIAETLRSMFLAALRYAEARLRLFCLEGKEVLHRGLAVVALSIIAMLSVIITYAGIMIALVLWMARMWWDGDVLPAVMAAALGHALIAAGCAGWVIHVTRGTAFFHATLKEFKEDRQWLDANHTSKN